jgi:hypothetical protein
MSMQPSFRALLYIGLRLLCIGLGLFTGYLPRRVKPPKRGNHREGTEHFATVEYRTGQHHQPFGQAQGSPKQAHEACALVVVEPSFRWVGNIE